MRKLRTSLKTVAASIIGVAFFVSCSTEDLQPESVPEVSQAELDMLASVGFNVSDGVGITDGEFLDYEAEQGHYLLEGDIIVPKATLEQMMSSPIHHQGPNLEQYRTTNLVTGLPRTLTVIGYTGGSLRLTRKMRRALELAVQNYNQLNTGLTLSLSFGTNWQPKDIVVYKPSGSAGGSAGFPSGGNPYKFVQIFSGTNSFSLDVNEHVMTHEIGHCVGMRHSDWFDRSFSCGGAPINEGQAGVGAIWIPGTPEGFDANSLMNACFSSSEDGEFGANDIVALEYLY